ncbi:MAG TPA: molybdopterin-dependent oxidoreductase [Janthinobacterium sp.]|nr:molybdopterin-dependent oxidoreductase [Janthinobacterium sp.]
MKKRQFLGAAALAGAALPTVTQGAPARTRGPALLTVTGAIAKANRGPFDAALDQMMHKQKISFEKAYAFDFDALLKLPARSIKPTLEYDGKAHVLRGPSLLDVLAAAGASLNEGGLLVLRAVDGFAVSLSPAQARAQGFIVATHLDGATMALGGLGPLWAVYDADRVPAMAARPLAERFGSCPWALYHVDVVAGKN